MKRTVLKTAALAIAIMLLLCGCAPVRLLIDIISSLGKEWNTPVITASPAPTYDPNIDYGQSGLLFWRAENPKNGAKLYLLGSIHVAREDTFPLHPTVMQAYERSGFVAVESDVIEYEKDFASQLKYMRILSYSDGTHIYDHIPKELYDEAVACIKENSLYLPTYDSYMPALWSSIIESSTLSATGLDANMGIDRYFLKAAKRDGKEVRDIEDVLVTAYMMADLSEELQESLLRDALASVDDTESLNTLFDIWLQGDEKQMEEYLFSGTGDKQRDALDAEYYEKLLYKRNEGMVEKADEYLKQGGTGFYIVGAAHMIGDKGVIEGLRRLGYIVNKD